MHQALYSKAVAALAAGGFTLHAVTGEAPKSGYVTAFSKATECVLDAAFGIECLAGLLAQFCMYHDDLLCREEYFVGAWINEGKLYLDVVKVYQSREEALAVAAGAQQTAIYDVVNKECIRVC